MRLDMPFCVLCVLPTTAATWWDFQKLGIGLNFCSARMHLLPKAVTFSLRRVPLISELIWIMIVNHLEQHSQARRC